MKQNQQAVDIINRAWFCRPCQKATAFTVNKPCNPETLMSLEEALNRNSDLLEKNIALQEKILGLATSNKAAAAAAGEDKPKATRTTKAAAEKAAETVKAPTLDEIKPTLQGWLNEFPKNGDNDHPETAARKGALKEFFGLIGVTKLPEVTKPEDLTKLKEWAETQVANGRITEDEPAGDDDDMGLE
jgi:hypothetical protein